MPIEYKLVGDGQVMHFKLVDPWTMEELFKGFAAATAIRDSVYQQDKSRRIHTLIDLVETKDPPPQVMQGRKIPGLSHPTGGEVIVVAKDAFTRSVTQAMLRVMHSEGHFYESLDAAWAYLNTIIQKMPIQGDTDSSTTGQS